MIVEKCQQTDQKTYSRVLRAFQEIKAHFSSSAASFSFSQSVTISLQIDRLEILEELKELTRILEGTSELYPWGVKWDDAVEVQTPFNAEELEKIKAKIWQDVAEKIDTTRAFLKAGFKSQPTVDFSRHMDERLAFEKAAEGVRLKQEQRLSREGALALVCENGLELGFLDDVLKNDPDIVLKAVTENGCALEFAHERLRNNIQIVVAALKCSRSDSDQVAQYIGEELRGRPQLLEAIASNEVVMAYGSDDLVYDFGFILDALKVNPFVLQLLHESLRCNKELVLEGLRPLCYQQDENKLRAYVEQMVGTEARPFAQAFADIIQTRGNSYLFLSEDLKSDEFLIAEWIKMQLLYFGPEHLVPRDITRYISVSKQYFAHRFCGLVHLVREKIRSKTTRKI